MLEWRRSSFFTLNSFNAPLGVLHFEPFVDHVAGVRIAVVPVSLGDCQLAIGEKGTLTAVQQDWGGDMVVFRQDVVILEPLDGDLFGVEAFDEAGKGHIWITRFQLFVVGAEEVHVGAGHLALLWRGRECSREKGNHHSILDKGNVISPSSAPHSHTLYVQEKHSLYFPHQVGCVRWNYLMMS